MVGHMSHLTPDHAIEPCLRRIALLPNDAVRQTVGHLLEVIIGPVEEAGTLTQRP